MNLVITGFMGTGKSKIGQLLSQKLNFKFIDTDELIVKREKMSINEIFAKKGEKYFRDIETEIIKEVAREDNCVIATGGGAVLKKENIDALRKNGKIINLTAQIPIILQRTSDNNERPLLNVSQREQKMSELLNQREQYYQNCDLRIDTSELSPQEVCEKIIEWLNENNKN